MRVLLTTGKVWNISKKLQRELDILIDDVIHSDMDLFIVLDGEEGSGKSYAARGLARYIQRKLYRNDINVDFSPDNIHFRQKEYIEASKQGKKFDILVLDEGRGSLGRSKDKKTKAAVGWVSRCRYMRQFHIICVPAYHDLNPYIGQWRMRAVIHFKKSYRKKKDGDYRIVHGEYKLYCDREGLRFHSRFVDYQYPKGWADWNNWSAKEVFSDEELTHYNAKKDYYARLEEGDEAKFSFSENQGSGEGARIIPT